MNSSSKWLLLLNAVAGSVLLLSFIALWWFYYDRMLPGVTIEGVSVSGLTQEETKNLLSNRVSLPPAHIMLMTSEYVVSSSSAELGIEPKTDEAVSQAFAYNRDSSPIMRVWNIFKGYFSTYPIEIDTAVDEAAVETFVEALKEKVPNQGQMAHATLGYSGSPSTLEIFPGTLGIGVNKEATKQSVVAALTALSPIPLDQPSTTPPIFEIQATLSETGQLLSEEELALAKARATLYTTKSVELTAEELTLKLNDQELVSLLSFPQGYNQDAIQDTVQQWQARVNHPAQEPVFTYDEATLKVTEFVPPKPGTELNVEQATSQLQYTLEELEKQAALPPQEGVTPTKVFTGKLDVAITPSSKSLAATNNLGINERIGFGESEYAHSIPSRIHNVANASKIINNYIIKPGEEFSFNKALGEVSRRTGFQPAYVISGGRTVLGDGGGVCQVSTTVFRSALDAGLPITKRKAHSYRVSYYELDSKPGVDATVYSGDVDLRFMNDTGHHILISTNTDSENLYMTVEMYGTSDGRTAEIVDHKTWDYRPPAATVYIPDPTLPPGRLKQVDWSASGIKASFKNVVKDKNGQVIREEEFYSNYVPWSAKYLRGI